MPQLIESNRVSPFLINGPREGIQAGQNIFLPWQMDSVPSGSSNRLPQVSRRRFLGTAAGVTIGLCLLTTSEKPKPAYAQVSSWPYQSNEYWFPLMANEGLRLHDKNGPLDIYDQTYGTRVRAYFEEYANWALYESVEAKEIESGKRPDTRRTWGYCSGAAVTINEMAKQRALEKPKDKIDEIFADPIKFGVLVAYHAGFAHFRPELYNIQANNEYFKQQLNGTKTSFVGRINVGKVGDWYHTVHGISEDKSQLMVTGFGKNNIWVPATSLEFSYLPESLEESIQKGRSKYIQEENKRFRTDELTQQRAYEFAQLLAA